MKQLHAQMYLGAGVFMVIAMANGTLQDGNLVMAGPWSVLIKLGALLAIAGWVVEALHIVRRKQ